MAKRKKYSKKTHSGARKDYSYPIMTPGNGASLADQTDDIMQKLEKRRNILKEMQFTEYVEAPAEYHLPEKAKFALKSNVEKMDHIFPVGLQFLPDAPPYPAGTWEDIRRHLIANNMRHDLVELDIEEYRKLSRLTNVYHNQLPPPFLHEPLEAFTTRIKHGDGRTTEIHFAPTRLEPIAWGDAVSASSKVSFYPKVDFVEIQGKDIALGSIGLCMVVDGIYSAGVYLYPLYCAGRENEIVDLAWAYFSVQYAYRIYPAQVVEKQYTQPKTGHGGSNPTRSLNTSILRRTIYLGRSDPDEPKREFVRRTDCWYNRGTTRHYKDGRVVEVKGFYKGPKRNDPTARRRVKRYRTDT